MSAADVRERSRILVVEDHAASRMLLTALLKGQYDVKPVVTGEEALDAARTFQPELVLLDIDLPGISGFETLERLYSGIIDPMVPVLFLTGRNDTESRDRGLSAGAVDYLTKPYDRTELTIKVRNHLALYMAKQRIQEANRVMALEMKMAAKLQRSLLPQSFPTANKVSVVVRYEPSSIASGDFYDVIDLGHGLMGFTLVDVSGHGVRSAMIGAMFKMAFQTQERSCGEPASLLAALNDQMCAVIPSTDFLTVFYGVIDAEDMRLYYANAGHPKPLLRRAASREIEDLEVSSLLLGAVPGAEFEEGTAALHPGDQLLLFTDGVTECAAAARPEIMYGRDRLRTVFASRASLPAVDLLEAVIDDLKTFSGGQGFADDVSLLLITMDG